MEDVMVTLLGIVEKYCVDDLRGRRSLGTLKVSVLKMRAGSSRAKLFNELDELCQSRGLRVDLIIATEGKVPVQFPRSARRDESS